jgi:putative endopeptidase
MNNKTVLRRSVLATMLCFSVCTSAMSETTATSNNLVVESQTMDKSADACTDFFQYSNGKWLANNPIPADRARYSAYDEVTERNLIALKSIAEAAAASTLASDSPATRLVGSYYPLHPANGTRWPGFAGP